MAFAVIQGRWFKIFLLKKEMGVCTTNRFLDCCVYDKNLSPYTSMLLPYFQLTDLYTSHIGASLFLTENAQKID